MSRFLDTFVPPIAKAKEDVGHRHATWIELFYDLVFVISMARLTEFLAEHLSINGFLSFLLLFVPVWWAWVGYTMYVNRFDTDDTYSRMDTFVQMFGALLLALFVTDALGVHANAFALSYIGIRLTLTMLYWKAYRRYPRYRKLSIPILEGFNAGIAFWIISLFFPTQIKFILWKLAY